MEPLNRIFQLLPFSDGIALCRTFGGPSWDRPNAEHYETFVNLLPATHIMGQIYKIDQLKQYLASTLEWILLPVPLCILNFMSPAKNPSSHWESSLVKKSGQPCLQLAVTCKARRKTSLCSESYQRCRFLLSFFNTSHSINVPWKMWSALSENSCMSILSKRIAYLSKLQLSNFIELLFARFKSYYI